MHCKSMWKMTSQFDHLPHIGPNCDLLLMLWEGTQGKPPLTAAAGRVVSLLISSADVLSGDIEAIHGTPV